MRDEEIKNEPKFEAEYELKQKMNHNGRNMKKKWTKMGDQGPTTSTNKPFGMKKPKMNRNGRNPKKQWTTRMGRKRRAGEKQRNGSQSHKMEKKSERTGTGELGTSLNGED